VPVPSRLPPCGLCSHRATRSSRRTRHRSLRPKVRLGYFMSPRHILRRSRYHPGITTSGIADSKASPRLSPLAHKPLQPLHPHILVPLMHKAAQFTPPG